MDDLVEPLRVSPNTTIEVAFSDSAGTNENGATGSLPKGTQVRYFGDYELQNVLGEGGMGIVYKARQMSLNRAVALKMIRAARFPSADEVHRLQNEAEAVARLDHPNIVPIFEVGRFEDQHYFSMKMIAGESLDRRLKEYAADPRLAARLVALVAEAIHHAHQRGILHRDLKPANILLDADGQPHVTDFGLAKRVEGDSELTRSGAIVGTPAYMAPEQASAKKGAVTTATDVHGLGAILYALLTSRAPFGGTSVLDTLEQVRERPPDPPRKLNPRVPQDVQVICLKCLEKDPRRRYASADALTEDLRRWLAGEPIAARAVGYVERVRLLVRRHPTAAALSGTSLVALIAMIAAGFFITYNGELKRANRIVEHSRAQLETAYASEASARHQAEAAEKIASEQRAIAVNALDEARNALDLANNFLQAMQITEEQLQAPPSLSFPADRFEFVNAMRKNQEIAAKVAYLVDETLEPMVRGARLPKFTAAVRSPRGDISLEPMMRGDEALDRATSHNWQGHHDLVLGRLLAIKVRCYEYNWACARMKKDPHKFSNTKFNAWRLVSDDNIVFSKGAADAAREAKSLLKRVVDEHPGSAWAFLAQRELNNPFGFRWVENYVKPVVPETPAAAEANQKQKSLLNSATDLARQMQWERVRWLLDQAGDPMPGTADATTLWQQRGDLFALLGLWDRAAAHYNELVRLRPDDALGRHHQILALLAAGDRGAALRAASDLVDRFRKTTEARAAADVVWSCVLSLGAVTDHQSPGQLAEIVLEYYPEGWGSCVAKMLGGALYRAGRFEDAIRRLEEGIRRRRGASEPEDWVFLAMAHHRLGHHEEARHWLERFPDPVPKTSLGLSWSEVEMRLLRSEAEAVILYDPIFPADPFAR